MVRQATEYQENHDTYTKKIKDNLIIVNDLLYKYRRILIVNTSEKHPSLLCIKSL